jgi:hypothetical protein
VFQAAKDAPSSVGAIRVQGKATIDGTEVVRSARGGGLTWPTVNTPGIARLADSIVLAVRETRPFALTAVPARTTVTAGEKLPIVVRVERAADWADNVQLAGFNLPPGATVALVPVAKNATEGKVELALPANAKPGTYTFLITGAGQVPRDYGQPRDPKKPRANNLRDIYPSNPITITIAPSAGAKK